MPWIVSWNKANSKTREKKDFGEHKDEALKYANELEALGEKFVSNINVAYKKDKSQQHWYFK
jgi:hypothetical protein